MSDDGERREPEPEAEAQATEEQADRKGPKVMDANLQAAQRMAEQINRLGVQVQVDVRAESERRALWQLLIAKGLITGAEFTAQVHAQMAEVLAGILQQVEQERLRQRERFKHVQPARAGDLVLPERLAAARRRH